MPPNLLLYLLLMSHLKLTYIWKFGSVSNGSGMCYQLASLPPQDLHAVCPPPGRTNPRWIQVGPHCTQVSAPAFLFFQPQYLKQQLCHSASPSCFAPWHTLSVSIDSLSPTALLDGNSMEKDFVLLITVFSAPRMVPDRQSLFFKIMSSQLQVLYRVWLVRTSG